MRSRSSVRRWATGLRRRYRRGVTDDRPIRRVAAVPRPAILDRFQGMWVAVVDGEVIAAEHTSHKLAARMHDMDHRKRGRATVEYVRPTADSYIVGVG